MECETKCNIYFICEGFASKNFALLVLQVIDLLQLKNKMLERLHHIALLNHNSLFDNSIPTQPNYATGNIPTNSSKWCVT